MNKNRIEMFITFQKIEVFSITLYYCWIQIFMSFFLKNQKKKCTDPKFFNGSVYKIFIFLINAVFFTFY